MSLRAHAVRPGRTIVALAALALAALLAVALLSSGPPQAGARAGGSELREVVFAGNNWAGTASVLDPRRDYEEIARINIIPDEAERMDEILNPLNPGYEEGQAAYYAAIKEFVGEGHDQYVDDMYTTPGGELLVVSRPSFKDVVGIDIDDCADLNDCEIEWRFEVAGERSDHMALSPNGNRVAVSASTGNVVHILDTTTGQEVDQFPSGDSPHENTYSKNGERLIHASIGRVYTPNQEGNPGLDSSKGERVFYVMDTDDYEVKEDIDVRKELDKKGREDLSEAVRPMALTPNEHKVFFQVSFFHGFIVYSFRKDKITRIVRLPNKAKEVPEEQYLLNSAHHGIAMNGKGTRLCVAGTMSDYAAIVKRKKGFPFKLKEKGEKPYWATTSEDGRRCYVSWSGTDAVSVFSYRNGRQIAKTKVGDHPQRVRTGYVPQSFIDSQP